MGIRPVDRCGQLWGGVKVFSGQYVLFLVTARGYAAPHFLLNRTHKAMGQCMPQLQQV